MWTYGQTGRRAVMSMALAVLACGSDSKTLPVDGGEQMGSSQPSPARCGDTTLAIEPAQSVMIDGSVVRPGVDAGDSASDASLANGMAGDARAGCDVVDPRYGCGIALSPNWLRFESGLEVDRRYERGWSPVFEVDTRAALVERCAGLRMLGIPAGQFKVPAITDARTLAGGCENTVLGSSGCAVKNGTVLPSTSGTCRCDSACVGPNHGKFCLPDVPECVTLWTETICEGGPECPYRKVWLYDVTTGAVELAPEAMHSPLLARAKGRCFTGLPYPIP